MKRTRLQGHDYRLELNKFLRTYRDTPHATTNVSPSVLLFGRSDTSRLPKLEATATADRALRDRDALAKSKSKKRADKHRRARSIPLKVGEEVVVRQKIKDKWTSTYSPEPFIITEVNGSMGNGRPAILS